MERKTYWKVEDMAIGDYIEVQVINKQGDRNLDGMILRGTIVELTPSHNQVQLDSGWCCQTKDKLLKHFICRAQMKNLDEDKLLRLFDLFFPKCGLLRDKENQCDWIANEIYQQIKERIQKKLVKLHDANIKWIEDIIDIILDNVACDHEEDEDGAGKKYYNISYTLVSEEDVLKKCIAAIPEVELKLDVDKQWIIEKGCEASRFYLARCRTVEDSRNFIRSFIKELEEKIR